MSLAIGIQRSAVYPNLRECLGDTNENIRIALSAASSALLIPTAFRKELLIPHTSGYAYKQLPSYLSLRKRLDWVRWVYYYHDRPVLSFDIW